GLQTSALSLHDALPICEHGEGVGALHDAPPDGGRDLLREQEKLVLAAVEDSGDLADQPLAGVIAAVELLVLDLAQVREVDAEPRSEEHTSELQSRVDIV